MDNFTSVTEFRNYVASFGGASKILFVFVQFVQVIALPIPSAITVGAGVLLFGPIKCALLSSMGVILGSISAFFIGRKFGYSVVKRFIGEENLNKALRLIGDNDKLIFTTMFIFPFFPDDLLCFVAGLTKMSAKFFVVMIIIVRIITAFVFCLSLNNNLIPYDKSWGIIVWVLIFVSAYLSVLFLLKRKNNKSLVKQM